LKFNECFRGICGLHLQDRRIRRARHQNEPVTKEKRNTFVFIASRWDGEVNISYIYSIPHKYTSILRQTIIFSVSKILKFVLRIEEPTFKRVHTAFIPSHYSACPPKHVYVIAFSSLLRKWLSL
jgi:hypothetical protein